MPNSASCSPCWGTTANRATGSGAPDSCCCCVLQRALCLLVMTSQPTCDAVLVCVFPLLAQNREREGGGGKSAVRAVSNGSLFHLLHLITTLTHDMASTLLPSAAPLHARAQLQRPTRRGAGAERCAAKDTSSSRGFFGGGGGARGFFGGGDGGAKKWANEKAEVLRLADAQKRGVGHSKDDRAVMVGAAFTEPIA